MNREEAIKVLNMVEAHGLADEAKQMAIEALRHDTIFEQIKWERDAALQTLEEHGIGLGQRADRPKGEMLVCPNCGLDVHSDFDKCPRCGADMRGEEE